MKRNICTQCPLSLTRVKQVRGHGAVPARILFVCDPPSRDEDRKGIALAGEQGVFFKELVRHAAELAEVSVPSYYVVNCILCRPADGLQMVTRDPSQPEMLACKHHLDSLVRRVMPVLTIFVGKIGEKYHRKMFKQYDSIIHPSMFVKQGGKKSHFYSMTVRKLSDIFLRVKEM